RTRAFWRFSGEFQKRGNARGNTAATGSSRRRRQRGAGNHQTSPSWLVRRSNSSPLPRPLNSFLDYIYSCLTTPSLIVHHLLLVSLPWVAQALACMPLPFESHL